MPDREGFSGQVGAFGDVAAARGLAEQLEGAGYPVYVAPPAPGGEEQRWRVRVGPIETRERAERVASELKIAQEEGKPYLLLWGRREMMCKKPVGARPNDAMYSWTLDTLRTRISATLREAQPLRVPDRFKRA